MIGAFDEVEIMLDDHDGVAAVTERLQDVYQLRNILGVQACGRLVQQVERFARGTLG